MSEAKFPYFGHLAYASGYQKEVLKLQTTMAAGSHSHETGKRQKVIPTMVATVCLFVFMIVATATDIWRQKIYNWTTYTGIGVALALSGLATMLDWNDLAIGFQSSVIGLLSCSVIMLICFVLFQIGGGDVKLLAMVGAFLGPQLGIETLLWTFVLGGATAVIILIWKIGFFKLVSRLIQQMMLRLSIGNWDPLSEDEKKQLRLPLYLAPSALLAAGIVKFSLVEKIGLWING